MIKKILQRDTKPKLHTTVPEKKKLGEEQRNDAVSRNNNNTINYQHIINTYILHNVVHIIQHNALQILIEINIIIGCGCCGHFMSSHA